MRITPLAIVLVISLVSSPAMAKWWRNLNPFAKRTAKGQLRPSRDVVRKHVLTNLAASKAARKASRFGKPVQMQRAKPFNVSGPYTVLRDGYTLTTNLSVSKHGFRGWDSAKNAVVIDMNSKPIRRFRRAAARLRGQPLELKEVVDRLKDLITTPNKRSAFGLRLLGLEKLSSTSDRKRVRATGQGGIPKLSDFVRHGEVSNLEKLLLMQIGLQAAGVKAKLVAGKVTWREGGEKKAPMWIEVSRGRRKPEVITTSFGYVDLLKNNREVHTAPDKTGNALTLERLLQ